MESPLVSIIIPVYNVRPYLARCLDSIQTQTYRNFEALLVDDGSTDGSGELCRVYADGDPRFHILRQQNGGAAAARNLAIDRARGKYLQFADGDDWLTPDATETFVRTAEATGCDLVISHFYRVANGRQASRGHIKSDSILTRHEFAEHVMKAPANFYYGVLWNKLYRRAIVEANHLRCPADVSWCEDFLFNMEYYACARLVATVSRPLYYYLKREGSIVNTQATLRKAIQTKRMTFQEYKELYRQLDLYEDRKATIYRYLISAAVDGTVGPFSNAADGATP